MESYISSDREAVSMQSQTPHSTLHNLDLTSCKDVQLALDLVKAQRDNINKPE